MLDTNKIIKESDLEEECGVTSISLKRVTYFKQQGWKPFKIQIQGSNTADVKTDVWFRDERKNKDIFFSFTGFSIGYGGTGPRGFQEFLNMFDIKLSNFSPIINDIKDGPYYFRKYIDGWE